MLNEKKFFSKKTITVLIAAIVVLALLIVAVATGTVHGQIDCPDCAHQDVQVCASCFSDAAENDNCAEHNVTKVTIPAGWTVCGDCGGSGEVDGSYCTTCLEERNGDRGNHRRIQSPA